MIQRRSIGSRLKRLTFLPGLAILTIGVIGGVTLSVFRANAATCTANDILKCGFSSPSDFINKVEANNNGVNNLADLQDIYAHYGLSSADYANFASHAVAGEAMRDGRIIVNGKVVASGASSIGRLKSFQGSNPFTVTIAGHNYYGNTNDQAFASGVTELQVYVLFNSSGAFQFAVLSSCGNPEIPSSIVQPPPKPKPVPPPQPTPQPPTPSPTVACEQLTATPEDNSNTMFTFTATAQSSDSTARLSSAEFEFGDGTSSGVVSPDKFGGTTVTTTHTYASSGTFTASATLFFTIRTAVLPITAPACTTVVSPSMAVAPSPTSTPPPTPTPAASANANATATATVTTAAAPAPTTTTSAPAALPSTGAGDVIGLFSATTVLGYIGYRYVLLRKAKRINGQSSGG